MAGRECVGPFEALFLESERLHFQCDLPDKAFTALFGQGEQSILFHAVKLGQIGADLCLGRRLVIRVGDEEAIADRDITIVPKAALDQGVFGTCKFGKCSRAATVNHADVAVLFLEVDAEGGVGHLFFVKMAGKPLGFGKAVLDESVSVGSDGHEGTFVRLYYSIIFMICKVLSVIRFNQISCVWVADAPGSRKGHRGGVLFDVCRCRFPTVRAFWIDCSLGIDGGQNFAVDYGILFHVKYDLMYLFVFYFEFLDPPKCFVELEIYFFANIIGGVLIKILNALIAIFDIVYGFFSV